ncbi:MmgE/PrpD family protein, partial [Burkholderia pseudomallei]
DVHTTRVGYVTAGSEPGKWKPSTRETADHSLPYVDARAMLDGDIRTTSFSDSALRDPLLHEMIAKIRVEEDQSLTAGYPARAPNRVTA